MERWLIRGSGGHFEGWWTEGSTILWSGVLRMAQTFAEALPFVIVGMLSAGILRGMVGPERLRSMLGVGRWTGPMRAWGLGLLLPICALGALPVALELRRARIPSGTVISFVLVLLVMGFLGAFLPYGILQTAFTRDNPLAPLLMACVAIPV
jgi:uncharacterized membrane protein YraQ (UPF0718 family)